MKLNNKKTGMRRLAVSSEKLVGRKEKRTLRGIAIPKAFAEIAAKILESNPRPPFPLPEDWIAQEVDRRLRQKS